jgi:hypothetical protein
MKRSWIPIFFFLGSTQKLIAFETTRVLPKGIRSLSLKSMDTFLEYKTNSSGKKELLSKPLSKDLTFKNIVQNEEGIKKAALEGFLLQEQFSLDESLGAFSAQMKGHVQVTVPILSYGLTDSITLAIAMPYYQSAIGIETVFRSNSRADDFVARLHSPEYNQTQAAREASEKIGNAVEELNTKLVENGYQRLKSRSSSGPGDAVIALKYRFLDHNKIKLATTSGSVLPTGKMANPNILGDIPFGDGNFDLFAGIQSDYFFSDVFFANGTFKYTYQTIAQKTMRLPTEEEPIKVPLGKVRYQLGDKIDLQASLQYEPDSGLLAGFGYLFYQKGKDQYGIPEPKAKEKAEQDTAESSHYGEVKIGYSTVPGFKKGQFPIPLLASIEYKKHLISRNSPVKDMITADVSVFF